MRAVKDFVAPERFHTLRSMPSIDVKTDDSGVSQGKMEPSVLLNLIPSVHGIKNEYPPELATFQENDAT